ncbi:conjugal transfer protein TraB [Agrobacterium vitis]|uniref:conjugal transfer protein TraB n=1 Tax=Agrobacterium vitis TaxID=373 RepID=UPI001F354666|nr:conjugal transfer protein TraB [Agrobacterium vitis]
MTHDILDRSPIAGSSGLPSRSSRLIPDSWRGPVLVGLSIAAGTVGWSGNIMTLPVVMLFPLLWAQSPSRLVAAAVSAGYFLAASRGLPQGVANFYAADLWPGLLLWAVVSLAFVVVHAVLWARQTERLRAVRYVVAMVLMALPPFGIMGWAHPLTAAGILFPGWGWFGLGATAILLVVMTGRRWKIAVAALVGLYAWSATNWTQPKAPDRWKGVDLALGQRLGRDSSLTYQRGLIATARAKADGKARFVVLPESALGFWTPTVARLWQDGLQGSSVTVIAGAAVIDAAGYDNVMVAISASDARVLYRERMPVPVSMWQPWLDWTGQGGGARADLLRNPTVDIDGQKIAPLICYEQLILWPVLQSMLHSPDIIVATGNGWWTVGTSIVAIQKASVTAWSRLFGVPVIMAFNR